MIKELILKNRSYRRFYEDIEIDENQLLELINYARLSPSPRNLQALKFYISSNKSINEKIFPYLAWAGYLKEWKGPEKGERPSAYIIIVADKELSPDFNKDFIYTASGIAGQSILLGATEKGFGGCIIASIQKEKLAESINLKNNHEILLVIAIGKPKEEIIVEEINENENFKYWRDEKDIHHVPKRKLSDIVYKAIG